MDPRVEKTFFKPSPFTRSKKARRIPLTLPVRLKNNGTIYKEKALNLSTGGMFIRTDNYISPGKSLEVEFSLTATETLRIIAKVVWASEGVTGNEFIYAKGIGLQFTQLTAKARQQLQILSSQYNNLP